MTGKERKNLYIAGGEGRIKKGKTPDSVILRGKATEDEGGGEEKENAFDWVLGKGKGHYSSTMKGQERRGRKGVVFPLIVGKGKEKEQRIFLFSSRRGGKWSGR